VTTGQTVPTAAIALGSHPDAPGPVFTFPGYANGALPDGNYRLVLPAGSVADAAGRTMGHDYVLNFFVLAGDVNRDRAVNGSDFAILAGNFGRGGSFATYARGDLNGDGSIDGADFSLLAANFGKVLPAPQPVVVIASMSSPAEPAPAKFPLTKRRPARGGAAVGNAVANSALATRSRIPRRV
jgi:Dockerin type I domain